MNVTKKTLRLSAEQNGVVAGIAFGLAWGSFALGVLATSTGLNGLHYWGLGPIQQIGLGIFFGIYGLVFTILTAFFAVRCWQRIQGRWGPTFGPIMELEDGANLKRVGHRAYSFMLLAGLVSGALYISIWGTSSWPSVTGSMVILYWLGIIVGGYFVSEIWSILLHEPLHGVAMWISGTPVQRIQLDLRPESSYASAATDHDLTVRASAFCIGMPLLVLGVLPLLTGLVTGIPLLVVFGVTEFLGSSVDLANLWRLRGLGWNAPLSRYGSDLP